MVTGRRRTAELVAAAVFPVGGLIGVLVTATLDPDPSHRWWAVPAGLAVVAPGLVGLLVLRARPGHVVGRLLSLHALFVGIGISTPPAGDSESTLVVGQLTQGLWVLLYVAMVLAAYVFPSGRFLSHRWRRWVWFCLVSYVAFIIGATGEQEEFEKIYPGEQLPLDLLPGWLVVPLVSLGLFAVPASLIGAVACARLRLRRAEGDERLQLLWFTWAAISIPALFAACVVDKAVTGDNGLITILAISALGTFIPTAIGIAILRYRLFDIELVLSRTLTYTALTATVAGTYALVLWATRSLLDSESAAGLVGVAVVAVAVQPAHAFLRRRAERWVYGDRSDPVAALRRLSDRVEHTTDPTEVVQSVTDSVAEALRVERVWVELTRDEALPRSGDHVVRVPLAHRGERLGDLAVEVPRGRQLSTADLELLQDLARHAAVVVDAVHLTLDLQRSRARIVSTREEERRRLRRDLHDGLGPSLAAVVLKLNSAESRRDEADRARLLAEARAETRAAIDEVRRLVDDLRPPAIDEVGLVGAIRQRAGSLTRDDLSFEVGGPALLPTLPAAVEVAAYRIATEAMANVSRHSDADRCTVRLAVDGALELTVSDNGHGAALGTRPGVGWTSMSERAAELGGSCTITNRARGGTVVRAVLPLPADRPAGVPEVTG